MDRNSTVRVFDLTARTAPPNLSFIDGKTPPASFRFRNDLWKVPGRSRETPNVSALGGGDSAYCSSTNCETAKAKGRDSYFELKKSYNGKGTDAWAKTVMLWKEHPGRFYGVYKARTTIEAAFSAIKGRFACCVRSVTIHLQERGPAIVSICRNVGARRSLGSKDQAALPHCGGVCAPPPYRGRPGRFRPVSGPYTAGTRAHQTSKRPFAGPRGPLGGSLRAVLVIT